MSFWNEFGVHKFEEIEKTLKYLRFEKSLTDTGKFFEFLDRKSMILK